MRIEATDGKLSHHIVEDVDKLTIEWRGMLVEIQPSNHYNGLVVETVDHKRSMTVSPYTSRAIIVKVGGKF